MNEVLEKLRQTERELQKRLQERSSDELQQMLENIRRAIASLQSQDDLRLQ